MSNSRIHSLDALRAFALLLGVVFHSALSFVLLPDGSWAVGTLDTSYPLWWFINYTHDFRMELFFLLAGFFACLMLGKRGVAGYLRDRGQRVLLVFAVLLLPMKFLISILWIEGGLKSGWLQLPPDVAAWPLWRLAWEGFKRETLATTSLTHLWFLYYLTWVGGIALVARWALLHVLSDSARRVGMDSFRRIFGSTLAPVWLAIPLVPLLATMTRFSVDTPDKGLPLNLPVLMLYLLFFAAGWLVCLQRDLLDGLARRWRVLLPLGIAMSFLAWAGDHERVFGQVGPAMAWACRTAVAMTMTLSVLGWTGLFVELCARPSRLTRYLSDASYWVYLAHLPVVVALQIWLYEWNSVWLKLLVINIATFAMLFTSYQLLVRRTWIGRWLNGHKPPSSPAYRPM